MRNNKKEKEKKFEHPDNVKELLAILGSSSTLNIRSEVDDVWIERGSMYSAPDASFKMLKALSEFFGTEDIDVENDINHEGCETCDHGSLYGHHIQLKGATRNLGINGKFGY